jgi:hypothetical protein
VNTTKNRLHDSSDGESKTNSQHETKDPFLLRMLQATRVILVECYESHSRSKRS